MQQNLDITINDIFKNEFSKICISTFSKIIKEPEKRKGYSETENNYHIFSTDEHYAMNAFYIHSRISECLSAMDNVIVFLKRFYGKMYYEKNGIDIVSYSLYHYEMFLYKLTTLKDLYFQLINQVYQLSLTTKQCKWKEINNRKEDINNDTLFYILDQYSKCFKLSDMKRNKSAHEGDIQHKAFKEIAPIVTLNTYAKKYPIELDNTLKIFPGSWLNYRVNESRHRLLEDLRIYRYNAFMITHDLLDSLYEKFNYTISTTL